MRKLQILIAEINEFKSKFVIVKTDAINSSTIVTELAGVGEELASQSE